MKAEEIFGNSVQAMKQLLSGKDMLDSIKRAKERGESANEELLNKERENVNEMVRKIADAGGSNDAARDASQELIDAMVLRYLRNRDIFMRTFPEGLEDIDPDPVSIWASIMISPQDEKPVS